MKNILLLFALFIFSTISFSQTNGYVYNGSVGNTSRELRPVIDEELDRSNDLQNLIDAVSTSNNQGGRVILKAGNGGATVTYRLSNVYLKSNVHLLIEPGVIIKPFFNGGNKSKSVTIFSLGVQDDSLPANNRISNVKVACTESNKRFIVDVDGATVFRAFEIKLVEDFQISNIIVKDNFSKIASIVLLPHFDRYKELDSYDKDGNLIITNGVVEKINQPVHADWSPLNGEIKNVKAINADTGYGVVQTQTGRNISFRNLEATGGVTLRLESGAGVSFIPSDENQDFAILDNIYAQEIKSINGRSAISCSPHGRFNGKITIDNVYSDGSSFAVVLVNGFLDRDLGPVLQAKNKYKKGFFRDITINNIEAKYTTDGAQIEGVKNFKYLPESLKNSIDYEHLPTVGNGLGQADDNKVGPSINVIGFLSLENAIQANGFLNGTLTVTNDKSSPLAGLYGAKINGTITAIGFDSCLRNFNRPYKFTVFKDDSNKVCKTVASASSNKMSNEASIITLFPNPAKDIMIVSGVENAESISVIDLSGRKITVEKQKTENGISINISNLQPGVYMALIADDEKTTLLKFYKE